MSENQDNNLISVFSAPDEGTANIVAGLLESEGIAATIITSATTWGERAAVADSIERMQTRQWGSVAVAASDVEKSLELISAYQPEETIKQQEKSRLNWEESYTTFSLIFPSGFCACVLALISYQVWICNKMAEAFMAIVAAVSFLLYAWSITSSAKYVPSEYQGLHKATGQILQAVAFLLCIMVLRPIGVLMLPRSSAMAIYASAVVFLLYWIFGRLARR